MPTSKLILIIESSNPSGSILLADETNIIAEEKFTTDRSHNSELFEPLLRILAHKKGQDIGLVIVGSGPGSYSGVRVGMAAGEGIGIAHNCPVIAISSLLAFPQLLDEDISYAIGDARRGSYWVAEMRGRTMLEEPLLMDADEFQSRMQYALEQGIRIRSTDQAKYPLSQEVLQRIEYVVPSAEGLYLAWQQNDTITQKRWLEQIAQPIYLKPPHITPAKKPWFVQPVVSAN